MTRRARWLVAVDLAPAEAAARVGLALRDIGFTEFAPSLFVDEWLDVDASAVRRAVRKARRRAAGTIWVVPVGRGGVERA